MLRQRKNALVHALDMEVKAFVCRHLQCFEAKIEPYMPNYHATEISDPLLCAMFYVLQPLRKLWKESLQRTLKISASVSVSGHSSLSLLRRLLNCVASTAPL